MSKLEDRLYQSSPNILKNLKWSLCGPKHTACQVMKSPNRDAHVGHLIGWRMEKKLLALYQ